MVACRHPFLHHAAYPSTGVPAVVPFNSEYDERPSGYFGSMSRYLRTWLAVQVSMRSSLPAAEDTMLLCLAAGAPQAGWLCRHVLAATRIQLRARGLRVRLPLLLPIATEEGAGPTAHPAHLPLPHRTALPTPGRPRASGARAQSMRA